MLPERLRDAQGISRTGGLHAAGLFTVSGELLAIREDAGRHNSLDKMIGWAPPNGRLRLAGWPCSSGRGLFELVQKAVLAGIPSAAVSAPSSLAVDLAAETGLTLSGSCAAPR